MTPTDAAWLAGILEGEGCIDTNRGNPRIRVKMTDADIVLRAAHLMGAKVYSDDWNARTHGHRPSWVAQITGAPALAVLDTVLPHLGTRRTARATEIILAHRKKLPRPLKAVA